MVLKAVVALPKIRELEGNETGGVLGRIEFAIRARVLRAQWW